MSKSPSKPRGAVRQDRNAPAASPVLQRGADKHQVKFSDQSKGWIRHHRITAVDAWFRLLKTPLSSLMTLAVLAIALALPGLMYVGLKNIDQLSGEWKGDPRLSLYLQKTLSDEKTDQLSQRLLL